MVMYVCVRGSILSRSTILIFELGTVGIFFGRVGVHFVLTVYSILGPVIRRYVLILILITRLTRRVPLVEQELRTLPEHLSSPPVFSGVCVSRFLVLCVCFVDRCLSFCTSSFGHCVVCPSIYRFWLLFLIWTSCKLMWQTWTNLSICYVMLMIVTWAVQQYIDLSHKRLILELQ